jgi:hypothetical protein
MLQQPKPQWQTLWPHCLSPPVHWHFPRLQMSPVKQEVPQVPQLLSSVSVSTQTPVHTL